MLKKNCCSFAPPPPPTGTFLVALLAFILSAVRPHMVKFSSGNADFKPALRMVSFVMLEVINSKLANKVSCK